MVKKSTLTEVSEQQTIKLLRTSESHKLKCIRHTASHVMAMAVQRLFPQAKVTIGPWTEVLNKSTLPM